MTKKPWKDFTCITSPHFVHDLVGKAWDIAPADLVDMAQHRIEERSLACGGHDPLRALPAYAQDELAYSAEGRIVAIKNRAEYLSLPREAKVNKFGPAYRREAKLWLHKTLADIVVGAAIYLYQTQGWNMVLYDGLRTVDGAYNLYLYAPPSDMDSGLLSMPGTSAHNKGLAVDSMFYDANGQEIDMGAHFDHLDMEINSRTYDGNISAAAKHHRLIREAAFLRAAFSQGKLIAPLRTEFWDDRLPENREDLWRVLDSAARTIGLTLLPKEDLELRKANRAAFAEKWERWSYADFLMHWQRLFDGHEEKLMTAIGIAMPSAEEKPEFYHGNYNPIYDEILRGSDKHLT